MKASSADRFRSALCAVAELGAELGKLLGLPFQVGAVREALERHWEGQAIAMKENVRDPVGVVRHYILDNIQLFMVYGGPQGSQLVSPIGNRYVGELRTITKDAKPLLKSVIIPKSLLREFVREYHYNWAAVRDSLERGTLKQFISGAHRVSIMEDSAKRLRYDCYVFTPEIMGENSPIRLVTAQPVPATDSVTR